MTWYRYWTEEAVPQRSEAPGVDALVDELDGDGAERPPTGNGSARRPFHVEPGAAPRVSDPEPPARPGPPSRVVVIANQKGGVGKTTTAVSVAAAAAQRGRRTLLVDLDPQGNASSGLGRRPGPGQPTIYDVLVDGRSAADVLVESDVEGLRVLPSNIDLAGAEVELVTAFSREQRLRSVLEPLRDDVDLIVVDCPPSLGLLTVNALTAGTDVLIPIQCEYYALEGLGSLGANVDLVRSHLNPGLRVVGYALTMFDGRTRLSEQVVDEVRRHFGDAVFASRIPRSIRLAEAPSYGQPITRFDPGSRGAVAYHRLTDELLERLATTAAPLVAAGRTP